MSQILVWTWEENLPHEKKLLPLSIWNTNQLCGVFDFSEQYVAHQITSLQKSSTNKGTAVNLIYGP